MKLGVKLAFWGKNLVAMHSGSVGKHRKCGVYPVLCLRHKESIIRICGSGMVFDFCPTH